ncbi:hypothetical protein BE08_44830 [Sorangium cellulosum]|uniref:Secreted protein n=1 Tax=Sorangium cellulosum TaxID=56 RepID=A0A150P8S4_SORCE|nr:hypothetical protein BE08_44830 [Sorangium cellulosum]
MVISSWFMRHAPRAVLMGAAVGLLSTPGSATAHEASAAAHEAIAPAQEAIAPPWDESESREDIAQRRERAALLAPRFQDAIRLHSSGKALPILFSGIGAVTLAGPIAAEDGDTPTRIAWATGSTALLAGGIAALAAPETYRLQILGTAGLLSQGSLWLGFALHDSRTLSRMTPIALSAGYYVSGALSGLNLALSDYTPVSRLRADHALVATPAWRARLTGAQVAGIERDLLGTAPAIPNWAIYLPLALGGVAAAAPVLDSELPTEQRLTGVTLGLLTAMWSLAMMDVDHPAQAYQRDLRRAGLSLAPSGPEGTAGLTVSGKF